MDENECCPACDGHLEAEYEDRVNGGIDPLDHEAGRETDPDLEEWLAARATALDEQRSALADLVAEEW